MGNLAFHSSFFYARLAGCAAPLVVLLSDASERTKANAAGALGNLARNSAALDDNLAHARAPEAYVLRKSERRA